jgi:hypothetical protein
MFITANGLAGSADPDFAGIEAGNGGEVGPT